MRRSTLLAALVASAVLAGCGGGGSSAPALPASGGSSAIPNSAHASFVIHIPAKGQAPARAHASPQYITSSVQAVGISVVPAPSPSASPAPPLSGYTFFPLNSTEPYCSSGTSGLTCTVDINAPPGYDNVQVSTYDSGSNWIGTIISYASFDTQINANASNVLNITTDGVVSQLYASLDTSNPPTGSAATIPIRAVAADLDNDIIVGTFDMPITVADSDTSGATTPSSTSITSSSALSSLSLNYTGASLANATLTLSTSSPQTAYNIGTQATAQVVLTPGAAGLTLTPSLLVFGSTTAAGQSLTVSGGTAPYSVNPVCGAFVATTGASPTFTLTPAGVPGYCQTTVTDSLSNSANLGIFVQ